MYIYIYPVEVEQKICQYKNLIVYTCMCVLLKYSVTINVNYR